MFEPQNYPIAENTISDRRARPPSVLERLIDEKQRLTERLAQVNHAISVLEEAPQVTAVLETLSKIGF